MPCLLTAGYDIVNEVSLKMTDIQYRYNSLGEYNYKGKATTELIDILQLGLGIDLFRVDLRYLHIEHAAAALACRPDEPEAIEAICNALQRIGAFHIDQIEGIHECCEADLQKRIVGRFLRDHKCVPTTVALLHAATEGQSESLRHHATKSINQRTIKVQAQALLVFMQAVRAEIAKEASATICRNVFPSG